METHVVRDESELVKIAQAVLTRAGKRKSSGAAVVALYGDLGAGKTAFVKVLARELGIKEEVTSPTFVIMKLYKVPESAQETIPFVQLAHIDAYRVEDIDEMRVLHFDALLHKNGTIICIEWADNIERLLPEDTIRMRIALEGDTRHITIE